jgi:hypothetical protein
MKIYLLIYGKKGEIIEFHLSPYMDLSYQIIASMIYGTSFNSLPTSSELKTT